MLLVIIVILCEFRILGAFSLTNLLECKQTPNEKERKWCFDQVSQITLGCRKCIQYLRVARTPVGGFRDKPWAGTALAALVLN